MNITRDVVKDLLPLYVAGETSADSRVAVETFLATDRELSVLAASMREDTPVVQRPSVGGPMAPERRTLERARTLVWRRTWLLSAALFFTGLPLSFAGDSSGLRFVFLDSPKTCASFLVVAAAFWVGYAVTHRQTRVTGL